MRVILLEHPRPKDPERFQDVVNAPLSACLTTGYIASVLQSNNIQVEILDANGYGWSVERTIDELCKRPFDLLGVHTVYLWEKTKAVFDMLQQLRERRVGAGPPRPYINLYGFYPNFAYERILSEFPFIDSVTVGEPEFTFLELARKITAGVKQPHLNTNGIAYSPGNDVVIRNEQRHLIEDLDKLPFPLRNGDKRKVHTYILGSRGCYGNCTFCYINPFYGKGPLWRGRGPENIFEEICRLHECYKTDYFYFADANFFGPGEYGKERVGRLSDLILGNGLKIGFGIECRADDVEEETFSALVHAGLKHVFLGIESGSQRTLNRFKKGVSIAVNKRAIETVRRFGIEPSLGFVMFEPCSTLADIRASFDFLKEMRLLTSPPITTHLLYHKETLFQGTPDFPHPSARGAGANGRSFTGYEAACTFKDERVAELSDLAADISRKAMERIDVKMDDRVDTACGGAPGGQTGRMSRINQTIIDSFEKGLRALEHRGGHGESGEEQGYG